MYKNALSALPEALGSLTQLQELNGFNNKRLKLTHATGKLQSATELNFSANKVRSGGTPLRRLFEGSPPPSLATPSLLRR